MCFDARTHDHKPSQSHLTNLVSIVSDRGPFVSAPLAASRELADLGWSDFFADQIGTDEATLIPRRISEVHRARLVGIGQEDGLLALPPKAHTGDYAVGDWVLTEPMTHLVLRRLERRTVLRRNSEGSRAPQLAASNVDNLFIVTSCNEDFNAARLERYLVFANEAGTTPVILLTKADTCPDPERYKTEAEALQRDLPVLIIDPKHGEVSEPLLQWTSGSQTVAVVGSSGVGKSTLVNRLIAEETQLTGGTREGDNKGRHTTTSRSLHRIAGGGWVIDTPGIRTLQVTDAVFGLEMLFAEITELAPQCKFRNCTHRHEPGCAVLAAVKAGTIDAARFERWRKLQDEGAPKPTYGSGRR
jgi:ribosome biogenesis GTPase